MNLADYKNTNTAGHRSINMKNIATTLLALSAACLANAEDIDINIACRLSGVQNVTDRNGTHEYKIDEIVDYEVKIYQKTSHYSEWATISSQNTNSSATHLDFISKRETLGKYKYNNFQNNSSDNKIAYNYYDTELNENVNIYINRATGTMRISKKSKMINSDVSGKCESSKTNKF